MPSAGAQRVMWLDGGPPVGDMSQVTLVARTPLSLLRVHASTFHNATTYANTDMTAL